MSSVCYCTSFMGTYKQWREKKRNIVYEFYYLILSSVTCHPASLKATSKYVYVTPNMSCRSFCAIRDVDDNDAEYREWYENFGDRSVFGVRAVYNMCPENDAKIAAHWMTFSQ